MRLTMPTRLCFVLPVLFLLVLRSAHAAALHPTLRATTSADVIGTYILDDTFSNLVAHSDCAETLSFQTFGFDQSDAAVSFPAPRRFNILIPHGLTRVDNKTCESSGRLLAVQSGHPFASNMTATIIDTWARGGAPPPAKPSKLAPSTVTEAMARSPFIFAYDWDMRSCTGTTVPPGTAYMFFQPAWDVVVATTPSRFALKGRYKYLLVTRIRSTEGCVYRRAAEDPDTPLDKGPVDDPSLLKISPTPLPLQPSPVPVNNTGRGREPGDVATAAESLEENDPEEDFPTTSDPPAVGPEQEPETPRAFSPSSGRDGLPDVKQRPSCFPADSRILLSSGATARMADLSIGTSVRVSAKDHSKVFTFSHRDHIVPDADFIRIVAADGAATVTLSPGHYIYANGDLVAAHAVRVGDELELADGTSSAVVSVGSVRARGLFAPHSLHGDLIVDGVRVSSYTTALHPRLAHRMLAPLRWLHRAGVPTTTVLERTAPSLARFVPSGPSRVRN